MTRRFVFLHWMITVGWLALAGVCQAIEQIELLSYHDHPPFLETYDLQGNLSKDEQQGLTYDLAAYLNHKLSPRWEFRVKMLPRKRLDRAVAQLPRDQVVAWANPQWFPGRDTNRYLWTAPLLQDANLLVSHASKPIRFSGPASLSGYTMGGVLGHRYPLLDSLVNSGEIIRSDASGPIPNLHRVLWQRIDFTVLPRSTLRHFLSRQQRAQRELYVAEKPLDTYSRHLLLSKSQLELATALEAVLERMPDDPQWQRILRHYNLAQ